MPTLKVDTVPGILSTFLYTDETDKPFPLEATPKTHFHKAIRIYRRLELSHSLSVSFLGHEPSKMHVSKVIIKKASTLFTNCMRSGAKPKEPLHNEFLQKTCDFGTIPCSLDILYNGYSFPIKLTSGLNFCKTRF